MKKILAILLSVLMLLFVIVPVTAQEEKQATLTIGSDFAAVGDEATITVELSNNPGMAGMVLAPNYNTQALELVGYENGGVFTTLPNVGRNFVWAVGADTSKNGTLITLVFKVNESAVVGTEYPISVSVYECSDISANSIEVAVVDGSVTVTALPHNGHTWGDWSQTDAPTCTETGIDERECSVCHTKETRISETTGHTYPDGKDKCTVCGHFRDGIASLYGYSISLNGDISINFYFDITEATKNDKDAYILITYPGGTTEKVLLTEARTKTAGGITYYLVNPELPAKEISSIISARIVLGDGTEGILYEKSIRGYAETVINNADRYSAEQVTLMEKLIAYGEAARIHFGKQSAEHQLTEITAETLAAYEIQQSGAPNAGLKYYGSSVLLESETTIRHYFKLNSGNISDHTFLLDGKVVTPVNEAGTNYWYIDIPNIVSKDLDRVYTLEADGMTIEYSALSYAYASLAKYGEDASKATHCNTIRALYEYNLAANAHFEK